MTRPTASEVVLWTVARAHPHHPTLRTVHTQLLGHATAAALAHVKQHAAADALTNAVGTDVHLWDLAESLYTTRPRRDIPTVAELIDTTPLSPHPPTPARGRVGMPT